MPNGELRFDYLYFFFCEFYEVLPQKYKLLKEIKNKSQVFQPIGNAFTNLYENEKTKATSQQETDILIQEYYQKKNQNIVKQILVTYSLKFILQSFKFLIKKTYFKQQSIKQALVQSQKNEDIDQTQLNIQNDKDIISLTQQQISTTCSLQGTNISTQENRQLKLEINFVDLENLYQESISDSSVDSNTLEESIQYYITNSQNIIKKKIYSECVQNIDKIVKNYNKKQNYSHHQKQKEENQEDHKTLKFNINQKVYLSLVSIAKKVFYKHILKSSLMHYEESPFYYQNIMILKKELQQEGEEFINTKKSESLASSKAFCSLSKEEQNNVLGNILNIQLSLKDYITKSIMENPIRFTECVRHTECFDLSTRSYIKKLRKCPECFQYVGNFYEDNYLKFIIKFISRQNTQQNNSILKQQKRDCFFPYFIQSVNCYSNNGIFVPIIEYINSQTTPQLESSNLYPITNFIDLEYLYQIIKYNTYEKTQQMLCQFSFYVQNEDINARQPILSIVNFIKYGNVFQFKLNKVFNQNIFIEYPVRNSNHSCTHIDCFDISDLFLINQVQNFQDNNLTCPICNNSFKVEDLVYDKEYKNVINFVELSWLQKKNEMAQEENIIQKKRFSATIDFTKDIVTYLNDEMQQQTIRIQCLQSNFQEYKKIEQFSSINQNQIEIFENYKEDLLLEQEIWNQLYEESIYINPVNNSQNFNTQISEEIIQTEPYPQNIDLQYNDDITIDYFSEYKKYNENIQDCSSQNIIYDLPNLSKSNSLYIYNSSQSIENSSSVEQQQN